MTRMVFIIGFVVSFAAGLTIGLTLRSTAHAGDEPPRGSRGSWLAQQLQLTPQQREQMDAIWSETSRRGGGREAWAKKRELRDQRDRTIAGLIPEADKAAYDAALNEYQAASDAIDAQWRQSFQDAVKSTREILTPAQREKYEQLMSRHGGDRKTSGSSPGSSPDTSPAHPRGDGDDFSSPPGVPPGH